jgi:outer membrane lipoprotein-sorting protein
MIAISANAKLLDNLKSTSKIKSVDFIQKKYIEAFDKIIISSGEMKIKKDGFVINYKKPFEYSLIYDGDSLTNINYDMQTKSSIKLKDNPLMMVIMNYFNFIINMEFEKLDKDFSVQEKGDKLFLIPRDATLKKFISKIEIVFEENIISDITLYNNANEYTKFEITNINSN